MKALILRFDAPLMSFGSVMVDQHGFIDRYPGKALLTGLFGNALGWRHGDHEKLQSLQERLEYAARWDVRPIHTIDYQTVDLGQPKMRARGWTTRGLPEPRAGGSAAKFGTHQRYRHYWMDGLMTVAVTVDGIGFPQVEDLAKALKRPARPLFLGRKSCLPARPLLDPAHPIVEAESLLDALRKVAPWDRSGVPQEGRGRFEACWPAHEEVPGPSELRRVYDLRDWLTQLPVGTSRRFEGILEEG